MVEKRKDEKRKHQLKESICEKGTISVKETIEN
jgi:hypothetical protein